MDPEELARQVAGVAVLAEPVRRDVYLYVAAQEGPVSRDQASAGVGIPRHTAKFHLDRLVEEGLLEADFKRLTGRDGPGAGRPTKRYRRSTRQVSVALPDRHYDLAGELMARAIDQAGTRGGDVVASLQQVAAEAGAAIGVEARASVSADASPEQCVAATCRTLTEYGYEPRTAAGRIELANCPFHELARGHSELVCGMNLALLGAVAEQVAGGTLTARLDPAPDRCCVVMDTR